jgi:hypothetical protein
MYGDDFDPILKMAENAVRMQEIAATSDDEFTHRKECVNAWEKIGQYVMPKLKAVEVTGEEGGPVITTVERIIVKASD